MTYWHAKWQRRAICFPLTNPEQSYAIVVEPDGHLVSVELI